MKYMLLAYGNEEKFNQMSKDQLAVVGEKCKSFDAEMQAAGEVTWGGSLSWSSKSMRLKDGKLVVTDGPFAETKEVVGGVVIIEAPDFDAAVRLASLHPAARMGEELGWGIELRPMDYCPAIREAEAARGEQVPTPYYAIIFSSHRTDGDNGYAEMAELAAQRLGHHQWYSSFRVRIAKVEREYGI